jgi:hypothetical protein
MGPDCGEAGIRSGGSVLTGGPREREGSVDKPSYNHQIELPLRASCHMQTIHEGFSPRADMLLPKRATREEI